MDFYSHCLDELTHPDNYKQLFPFLVRLLTMVFPTAVNGNSLLQVAPLPVSFSHTTPVHSIFKIYPELSHFSLPPMLVQFTMISLLDYCNVFLKLSCQIFPVLQIILSKIISGFVKVKTDRETHLLQQLLKVKDNTFEFPTSF